MERQKIDWQLHSVYHAVFQGSSLRLKQFDENGDTMAKCVFKIVVKFELLNGVHSLVFDTIASNIGHWKRGSTVFESILEHH